MKRRRPACKAAEDLERLELYTPQGINYIRKKYGFHNAKSLGQNFLTDKAVIDAIIEAADIGEEDLVIEIGPGFGVLTREEAPLARKVCAIELDHRLIPVLGETLAEFGNVEVINEDVLKTDLKGIIAASGCERTKIIGNLPYYITTPILMALLEGGVPAESIVVMMQKEVAERVLAPPGGRIYGALSVAVDYYCEAEPVCEVPKEAFLPAPKVDSAVVKLNIRKERPVELVDEKLFFACIKAGFGQRRKTLLNSLTGTGYGKAATAAALEQAGIAASRRAETLSVAEFAAVANALAGMER